MISWEFQSWIYNFNWITVAANVSTWMVFIVGRRIHNVELKLLISFVLPKPQFLIHWIIFHINYIVDSEVKGLWSRIKLFNRMRPTVTVRWNKIASMSGIIVIEVIICVFDNILKADSQSNPSCKFLNFNSPINLFHSIYMMIIIYIVPKKARA